MEGMMPRATLTSDQFFLAIIAVLTKRGLTSVMLTPDVDSKFEAAHALLLKVEKKAGVQPNFSYRTNRLHGVSRELRDTIDSASRNNIVSLENPSFRRMKTKLTVAAADFHLARLPISENCIAMIVDECFSDLVQDTNAQTAA
jgi:hypothetical protein